MEFRFAQKRIVKWPVEIHQPMDGGRIEKVKVHFTYELLDQDDLAARSRDTLELLANQDDYSKAIAALAPAEFGKRRVALAAQIRALGDEFVDDATGEAMEFTPENLDGLLRIPYVFAAANEGLINASRGVIPKN